MDRTWVIIVLGSLLLVGAIIVVSAWLGIESCEDYDTVRTGKTTTQVCDNG